MLIFHPCEAGHERRKDIDKKVFCNIQQVCIRVSMTYYTIVATILRICQQQPYALKEVSRLTLAGTCEYNELDTLSYCNEDPNCMNRKSIYIVSKQMWAQKHPSLPVVSLHTSMDYPAPIFAAIDVGRCVEPVSLAGNIRSLLFQSRVDAVYIHRGLEIQPTVIS